ncbi:hypothetical protein BC332_28197 [Capsicum chinense]|nr:hypothetical protein BC332_28197 [Capsicum chinense]
MQGTKSSSALITGNSTIATTLPIQLSDQNHPLKGNSYSTVPSKASLTILVVLINSDSVFNMKNFGRSSNSLKSVETMRLIFSIGCGVMLGLFIGISFPTSSLTKLNITASIVSNYPVARDRNNVVSSQNDTDSSIKNKNATDQWKNKTLGRGSFLSYFICRIFSTSQYVRFVEIMAPVFSRDVWALCVAYDSGINDLIHGWRLDFALHKFLEGENAQKDYYKSNGIGTSNFTYNPNGMDPSNFISHSVNRVKEILPVLL